jgi:tetratricopeptide (TPR) repeat protein
MSIIRAQNLLKFLKIALIKIGLTSFFILFSLLNFSQNNPTPSTNVKKAVPMISIEDTLVKKTYAYIDQKDFDQAAILLSKNYQTFSESLKINWLYAYVLSLNKDQKGAKIKYEKAISISPKDKNLQMDYARLLYQMGKINKVEKVLSNFMTEDSVNAEFLLMQAYIRFWKGDLKNSRKKINQILAIYPETAITDDLTNQINEITSLSIQPNLEYQTDSQPLDFFAQHVTIQQYSSRFLNLKLEFSNYNFSPQKERAFLIKLNNEFYFDLLKLSANVAGGVYKNYSGTNDWIGGIHLTKKLSKKASINVGYSKEALLTTIASTSFNLTNKNLFAGLDYSNQWIVFNASYHQQFFKDDNTIKSIGSWVLSQPIKFKNFNFQFGYAFSYVDSEDILFIFDAQGVGVYDPYFTPEEQEIHAGLFILNYQPFKKLSIEAKLNYGFKADIRNPYPEQVTPTSIEIGGFYDATFTPIEITGVVNYNFSKSLNAKITYINQETFFYTRQNMNLGLNFKL